MEIKRGEKFQQQTTTPITLTDSKIIRRGENIQPITTQEPLKETPKQDSGIIRGTKIQEEKKDTTIQRGVKATITTNEIKEEKKTAPKESSATDSISKGMISRGTKTTEISTTGNSNMLQRGTANTNTTQSSGGLIRGAALQKPTAPVEEKKSTADGKDGGWRKK